MVYLSDQCNCLCISFQEIMDIAVIPVLKSLISDIVSTLLNTDTFGHYHVTKMVVTGSFLRQKEQKKIFNYLLTSEIEKEFKEQMRSRVYEFQVIIGLVTSCLNQPNIVNSNYGNNKISSFYDKFIRGELRIVANMTYWHNSLAPAIFIHQNIELDNKRVQIKLNGDSPACNFKCNIFFLKVNAYLIDRYFQRKSPTIEY